MVRLRGAWALAVLLAAAGPASAARRYVPRAHKNAEKNAARAQAYADAGMESFDAGDYAAAIRGLSKAVALKGESGRYFLLGYAHYLKGFAQGEQKADKEESLAAIEAFSMALALDPELKAVTEPYRLYHSLALCYETAGNMDSALDAYRRAIAAAPRNGLIPLYAGRLRWRLGDSDKAASNVALGLGRARADGRLDAALRLLRGEGFAAMLADEKILAVARVHDATLGAPAAPKATVAARVLRAGADDLRDAVRGTTPAEQRPSLRAADRAVSERLDEANLDYKYGRFGRALEGYRELLALNRSSGLLGPPQLSLLWEKTGSCLNRLGRSEEAMTALQRALQNHPDNAAAHYQLALAYAVSGRYDASLKALRASWRAAPSPGERKRLILLAKTDVELEPIRDLPAFAQALEEFSSGRGS